MEATDSVMDIAAGGDVVGVPGGRRKEQPLTMPVKPPPCQRLNQARVMRITMNGFELDMSKAVEKVYKYEWKMYSVKENGQEKEMHRGPKNDVASNLRHRAMWAAYQEILRSHPDVFGTDCKKFFYDCGINFYSINKLFDREEGEKEFRITMESISPTFRDFLGKKVVGIVARALACEEVLLHNTAAVSELLNVRERSLQQFLEIATTQMMYNNENHLIFGNKAYDKPKETQQMISGGKVLAAGLEKNVRFVGNSWDDCIPIVQVDAKKAAFFKSQSLINLLATLMNREHPRELLNNQKLRHYVAKQLKDLVVRTTHLKVQRTFTIFGLTTEKADDMMISVGDERMTVTKYCEVKHSMRLAFGMLPCVIERKPTGSSFHPMEVLEIVEGQRVELKKQTPELVDEMIQACRLLPQGLKIENETQIQKAGIDNNNPYLRNLGIKVVNVPRTANAIVQFPPAIRYRNGTIEPGPDGSLDWRLSVPRGASNRVFFSPRAPFRWVMVVFRECCDRRTVDNFIQAFVSRCCMHGMQITNPARLEQYDSTDHGFLHEKLKYLFDHKVDFVMFATHEKRDPVHDTMKLLETKHLVVTQHLHIKTLLKAVSNRGAEMTLDNLIMKMNLKLGGITHGLTASLALSNKNRLPYNVMDREWLRPSRMFFGLDMSHAAPQSLYERQSNTGTPDPTIVGMAYSCGDSPFKMIGDYWMQKARLHVAQNLDEYVSKAVQKFAETCPQKAFPEHVIVFRGGVSEGEYAKIMTEEAAAFRRGFEIALKGCEQRIRLTILTVQAHSNYRIFPDPIPQGSAPQQNVPPGTIVDSDIVHPTQTEFVLVAHRSIMGTARPMRCTVLVDDEPRMSMDELEGVTNALCYAHGIVTSPVSLPAHLYAAAELAKRGRNNYRTYAQQNEETASDGSGTRELFAEDGTGSSFKLMYEKLHALWPHKFWA